MPELPEVETVRRGLEPALVGRRLKSVRLNRPDLRFPFPAQLAETVTGKRVTALRRRAKYILIELEGGHALLVHLGMTGRFTVWPPDGAARNLGEFYYVEQAGHAGDGAHDHVVIDLDDGARVVYTDHGVGAGLDFVKVQPQARREIQKYIQDVIARGGNQDW